MDVVWANSGGIHGIFDHTLRSLEPLELLFFIFGISAQPRVHIYIIIIYVTLIVSCGNLKT